MKQLIHKRVLKTCFIAFVLIMSSVSLTGCKTAYAPTSLTGGYSVFPEDRYTFRITINANRFTKINEAEEMALLKASEITLKAGYRRFIVTANSIRNKAVANSVPIYLKPLMVAVPEGARPNGDITIRVLANQDPAFTRGLDAVQIYRALKPRHKTNGPRF